MHFLQTSDIDEKDRALGALTQAPNTSMLEEVLAMSLGMHLSTRWGRPVPLAAFLSWQLLAGAALLLPLAAVNGGLDDGGVPALDLRTLLGLGYTSLLATGVAYLAWFTAVERTSAAAAAFLGLLWPRLKGRDPVATAVVASVATIVAMPFVAPGIPVVLAAAVTAGWWAWRRRHPQVAS